MGLLFWTTLYICSHDLLCVCVVICFSRVVENHFAITVRVLLKQRRNQSSISAFRGYAGLSVIFIFFCCWNVLLSLFFTRGNPWWLKNYKSKLQNLFGSEPYSGRSSSIKLSCVIIIVIIFYLLIIFVLG